MQRRLKILSLCTRYLPLRAGADNYNHQVHLALLAAGHEVTVVAINDGKIWDGYDWPAQEVIEGIDVLRPQAGPGYDVAAAAIRKVKPDLVFGQFGLLPYTIERAFELDLPVVVFCHTEHGYANPLKTGLVEMVDLFVFNSTHLYDVAGCNVRHMIMPPPLEHERVIAAERDPKYITMVNLCPDKGTDMFYKLVRKFPEHQFLGVEGGYEDQVKKDYPNLTFHVHTPNIHEVYAQTSILLMPSLHESFGMAAVEAQANGIPVIASDLPGLRDSLGDGALFARPRNVGDWAAALERLDSVQAYGAQVERARHNVTRFDFRRDMRQLDIVLQDLVARKRQRPCLHGLMREYAALRDYVIAEFRVHVGREPKDSEVNKILEGPYKPHELVKVLGKLEEFQEAGCTM